MSSHPFDRALFSPGQGNGKSVDMGPAGNFFAGAALLAASIFIAPALGAVAGVAAVGVGLAGAGGLAAKAMGQASDIKVQKEMAQLQLETMRENLAGMKDQRQIKMIELSMKTQAHQFDYGVVNKETGKLEGGAKIDAANHSVLDRSSKALDMQMKMHAFQKEHPEFLPTDCASQGLKGGRSLK